MPADLVKVKELFLAALELPVSERSAYLDSVCAGDSALRRQIESMLQTHQNSGELLSRSPEEMMADSGTTGDDATSAFPKQPGESVTEGGQAGSITDDLTFLAPSSKPGYLGRLGHYEVQQVIGKGGFGIVLKAFDEKLHRVVAIKVLSPAFSANGSARKRFIREARAAAAVKNEHVVGIYDVQEDAQPPYLVMECIDGISLQDKIEKQGTLGVKEILRIGMQMAEGLAAAHTQGLVHRDIKPANILLENGVERVKITDFGLARAVDDASVTQSGTVAGTPMYMSPEQAEGLAIDHRSDLFSLGTVLYAMCTGHPPFRASGTHAVLKRVIDASPRPIREINPEVPDWLCDIVAKLHAKKPEDRVQTAKEVAELLGQRLADVQAGRAIQSEHSQVQSLDAVSPVSPVAPAKKDSSVLFGKIIGFVAMGLGGTAYALPPGPAGLLFAMAGFSLGLIALTILMRAVARQGWVKFALGSLMIGLVGVVTVPVCLYLLQTVQPSIPNPPSNERPSDTAEGTFDAYEISYDVPIFFPASGEAVNADDELRKAITPTGIKWSYKALRLEVIDGAVTLNGQGCGTVQQGDRVKLTWDGSLFVNDSERTPAPVAMAPAEAGWVQLFNGKDLTGWQGLAGLWKTDGNDVIGSASNPKGGAFNTFLVSKKTFKNFELRFQVRLKGEQGNSGLQIRSLLVNRKQFEVHGPQVDIGRGFWSDLYREGLQGHFIAQAPARIVARTIKPLGFNEFHVRCVGKHVTLRFNGYTTIDGNFPDIPDEGVLALQLHCGTPIEVTFRKIEIKELPPTDKDDKERLQGRWVAESVDNGRQLPAELCAQFSLTVSGNKMKMRTGVGPSEAIFHLNEQAKPKKIDIIDEDRKGQFGIYRFDGDRLVLCIGEDDEKDRPTEFSSKGGSRTRRMVIVFKRVADPPLAVAPFDVAKAQEHQEAWAKHLGVEVETTNSIGMKLRLIPPGEFMMGTDQEQIAKLKKEVVEAKEDDWMEAIQQEGPVHRVRLTHPFYVGVHEVTVAQFRQFVEAKDYKTEAERNGKGGNIPTGDGGSKPDPKASWRNPHNFVVKDDYPVLQVTWNDAQEFCAWLSKKEGRTYRLPTEAEWEIACRAGSAGLFSFGDDPFERKNHAVFQQAAPMEVGSKKSNRFGLFDMEGNAWEWCADWFGPYAGTAETNPQGPPTGTTRAVRGGSYMHLSWVSRPAVRVGVPPNDSHAGNGFRVVIVGDLQAKPPKETSQLILPPAGAFAPLPTLCPQRQIVVRVTFHESTLHREMP